MPVQAPDAPVVRLGHLAPNGISPSLYGLVERGAGKRPAIARSIRGTVEIRFDEGFAPVRMAFRDSEVVVEDAAEPEPDRPDVVIRGSLPDIVQLISVPLMGGVPRPTSRRGRAALASMAGGRVRIEGGTALARKLLRLLEI